MSLFQHPHLTRGIVHTAVGAFAVHRGIVDLPEEIGEALGWRPLQPEARTSSPDVRREHGSAPDAHASSGRH
jgi:hypothetical protein